jgi:hypothetical protein
MLLAAARGDETGPARDVERPGECAQKVSPVLWEAVERGSGARVVVVLDEPLGVDPQGACATSARRRARGSRSRHDRLLVTILQAMGLSPADYEIEGQPGYGSTSTSGGDPNLWPVDYDFGAVGDILPGIAG